MTENTSTRGNKRRKMVLTAFDDTRYCCVWIVNFHINPDCVTSVYIRNETPRCPIVSEKLLRSVLDALEAKTDFKGQSCVVWVIR